MTNNNQIWVSPMEWGWRVHKPWSSNDIIHTKTKAEAETIARKLSKNQKSTWVSFEQKLESKSSKDVFRRLSEK